MCCCSFSFPVWVVGMLWALCSGSEDHEFVLQGILRVKLKVPVSVGGFPVYFLLNLLSSELVFPCELDVYVQIYVFSEGFHLLVFDVDPGVINISEPPSKRRPKV